MDATLPAGWEQNKYGVFWRQGAQSGWFGMDTAPRNGLPFIWLKTTLVVGRHMRVEIGVTALHRANHDRESGGYWMGPSCSIPDSDAKHGWWAHSATMTSDGRLVMPHQALEYIREKLRDQ